MAGQAPALATALGVARLVRDHWDALDADFRRFYGLDLDACCFGPDHIGVRRLHALIVGLPPDSTVARKMGWAWDDSREMTATLVELAHDQAVSARAMVQAFTGKRFTGPAEPYRWPRPSVEVPVAVPSPAGMSRQDIRSTLLRRN